MNPGSNDSGHKISEISQIGIKEMSKSMVGHRSGGSKYNEPRITDGAGDLVNMDNAEAGAGNDENSSGFKNNDVTKSIKRQKFVKV